MNFLLIVRISSITIIAEKYVVNAKEFAAFTIIIEYNCCLRW